MKTSKKTLSVLLAVLMITLAVVSVSAYGTPNAEYKIIYDANGGTNAPEAQTFTKAGYYRVTDAEPYYEGYLFRYWTLDPVNETEISTYDDDLEPIVFVDGIVTLYAVWGPVPEPEDPIPWTFDEAAKTLTVSGTGEMPDYSYAFPHVRPWADDADRIEHVVIGDGITKIGAQAFESCSNLKTVSIPGSVKRIGSFAFYECGMESVTIPDGVTHIESFAFSGCQFLKTVTLPRSIEYLGELSFGYCPRLETVYYYGSETDWNAIGMEESPFSDPVTIVYNYAGPVKAIDVTVTLPTVGMTADFQPTAVVSDGMEPYGFSLLYLGTDESWERMPNDMHFEANRTYRLDFAIAKGENYVADDVKLTINGKTVDSFRQTNQSVLVKYEFQPEENQPSQPDPNMCHWCGKVHEGFFQGIIGFFHRIFAAIFGAKY